MRIALALVVSAIWTVGVLAQAPKESRLTTRYGIETNLDDYPQKTPREALESVVKALDTRRYDYLLAQLADPEFVDRRVQQIHGGKFGDLVAEFTAKLNNDPAEIKKLRRFLEEGQWDTEGNSASARVKNAPERVFLRKVETRWFLENQDRMKGTAKEK